MTIKVKYNDFKQVTRSQTFNREINDYQQIYSAIIALLKNTDAGKRKVRLIGVGVSSIINLQDTQIKLIHSEVEIFFNNEFFKNFTEEDYNYDENLDILNFLELKKLAKFVNITVTYIYKAPVITEEVKVNFIKNHKIIILKEAYPINPAHKRKLLFVISRDGEKIYRFGRFETEEYEIRYGFVVKEIKMFNEIIKNEKIKLDNPAKNAISIEIIRLLLLFKEYSQVNFIKNAEG